METLTEGLGYDSIWEMRACGKSVTGDLRCAVKSLPERPTGFADLEMS